MDPQTSDKDSDKGKKVTRPPNIRRDTLEALGVNTSVMCENCDSTHHATEYCHLKLKAWRLDAQNSKKNFERYEPDLVDDLEPPVGRARLSLQHKALWDLEDRMDARVEDAKKAAEARLARLEQGRLEAGIKTAISTPLGEPVDPEEGFHVEYPTIHRTQHRVTSHPVRRSKSRNKGKAAAEAKAKKDAK